MFQYRNVGNPIAHYDGTGTEILSQTGGQVDMIVVGAGTGGTVAGIGRKVRGGVSRRGRSLEMLSSLLEGEGGAAWGEDSGCGSVRLLTGPS